MSTHMSFREMDEKTSLIEDKKEKVRHLVMFFASDNVTFALCKC